MRFDSPSFTRRGCKLLSFAVVFLFIAVCGVVGQQTSIEPETQSPTPPGSPAQIAPPSAAGSTSTAQSSPNAPKNDPGQSGLIKLGAGDLIAVNVYNVPELTTKARIGNSGDVYLPLVDYVHVADLTTEEAQALIQKRLEDEGFVRNPHVTIFVDEATSQGVTVLGEVSKPGIYPDLGDRKLYEIISEAGGFTPSAARKVAIIRRNQQDAIQVVLPRNLAEDLTGNVDVLPGDTVTVPKAPIIYVVGDVGHPSGLLVDNGSLTVLQALALAGGTNRTAKMGGARIIRKGPTGMTETRVPLKKMLEAKAPDVTLQGDDILFVPLSGARVAANRGFEAAVSAATGLAVIAVRP